MWFEVRASPDPAGLALYFADVSARRDAQQRADLAAARMQLMASVTAELVVTLELAPAATRLARLLVPALADYCIVTVDDGNGPRDLAAAHADPAKQALLDRYVASRIKGMSDSHPVLRSLATGLPILAPAAAQTVAEAGMKTGPAGDLLAALAPESGATLPLLTRGRTLGALTLVRGSERPAFGEADLEVALEVAARAAAALDNARLYADEHSLAESLQRSLLTEPPDVDGLEIAVRYVPAAETASVGGDWFDSFVQADGATTVVIGDVLGHDREAAAAMGQVRGLLRGIAWHTAEGPAAVLSGLDAAMQGLGVGTTATAVVARIEQHAAPDGPGHVRVRWSNAGHPPPMIVRPDGAVTTLDGPTPDLLLGIDARTERGEEVADLLPGMTLLLYTDGLVERRGQSLDDGLAVLRETLGDLGSATLDDLCDRTLSDMLPDDVEDDVALIVVRLS
jgi:serine phosphatase RsbU (regulator of sigma subunit)